MVRGPGPTALSLEDLHNQVSTQAPWVGISLKKALDQGDRDLCLGRRGEIILFQSYMQNHMIYKKEKDKAVNWFQVIFLLSRSDAHESSALQITTILNLIFFISKMEMIELEYQLLSFSNGLQFTQ